MHKTKQEGTNEGTEEKNGDSYEVEYSRGDENEDKQGDNEEQ